MDLFAGSVAFGASYEQVCSYLFLPHFQLSLHSIFPTLCPYSVHYYFRLDKKSFLAIFYIFDETAVREKKSVIKRIIKNASNLKKPAQGFSLKVKRAIVTFCCFPCFFFFLFRYKLKFTTLVPFLIITNIFCHINRDQNLFSLNC